MSIIVKNNKFYVNHDVKTVYFIEVQKDKEYLVGAPLHDDGTFKIDESFFVEINNLELGHESIHPAEAKNAETLSDIWMKAQKLLA